MEKTRATETYKQKKVSDAKRRETKQNAYVEDFNMAVRTFLSFAECYKNIEIKLAYAVTNLATPVGSGTVARTERITISERAERAVIAWLRHQTTVYDSMKIPLIKGKRREVRRMLAEHSRKLLAAYRKGDNIKDTILIDALDKLQLPPAL